MPISSLSTAQTDVADASPLIPLAGLLLADPSYISVQESFHSIGTQQAYFSLATQARYVHKASAALIWERF